MLLSWLSERGISSLYATEVTEITSPASYTHGSLIYAIENKYTMASNQNDSWRVAPFNLSVLF